jgi:hypothetical protein
MKNYSKNFFKFLNREKVKSNCFMSLSIFHNPTLVFLSFYFFPVYLSRKTHSIHNIHKPRPSPSFMYMFFLRHLIVIALRAKRKKILILFLKGEVKFMFLYRNLTQSYCNVIAGGWDCK